MVRPTLGSRTATERAEQNSCEQVFIHTKRLLAALKPVFLSYCFTHAPYISAVSYVPPSLVRCFSDLIDMRLGTARRCDSGYQCIVVKATVMYTVSKLTGFGHYSLLTLMSSEVDVKRKCAPNLVNDVG